MASILDQLKQGAKIFGQQALDSVGMGSKSKVKPVAPAPTPPTPGLLDKGTAAVSGMDDRAKAIKDLMDN